MTGERLSEEQINPILQGATLGQQSNDSECLPQSQLLGAILSPLEGGS